MTLQAITSTSQWTLSPTLTEHDQCPECLKTLVHSIKFDELPKLLILEYPFTNIRTSHKIKVKAENNSGILGLRGTVYHGDNHFTSRFISSMELYGIMMELQLVDSVLKKEICV